MTVAEHDKHQPQYMLTPDEREQLDDFVQRELVRAYAAKSCWRFTEGAIRHTLASTESIMRRVYGRFLWPHR